MVVCGVWFTAFDFFIWAVTCDFQQCGSLTCVDSDAEPVQIPFKLRNSKWCSVSSLRVIDYSSEQQRFWSDCAYAQLIWAFADRTLHIVGNLMSRLKFTFFLEFMLVDTEVECLMVVPGVWFTASCLFICLWLCFLTCKVSAGTHAQPSLWPTYVLFRVLAFYKAKKYTNDFLP